MLAAFLLGIVQGLTEFLPISSSAHLILVPWLLGWSANRLIFDVALHVGTAISILLYFWRDWLDLARETLRGIIERNPFGNEQRRVAWFLVAGTLPAMAVGLTLEDYIETRFRSPLISALMLVVFALVLFAAERKSRQSRSLHDFTWADCFCIGMSQALALIPGVSRSGITISTAMFRDVNRSAAARYSFLLSTPVIVGAGALEGVRLAKTVFHASAPAAGTGPVPVVVDWGLLAAGFVSAAVTGFLCIRYFLRYLQTHTFTPFVVYRVVLAALIVVLYLRNS